MKRSNIGFEWSYRDLLISLVIIYMAFAVMALQKVIKTPSAINPGNVMVQLFWDPDKDADVDLWVLPPGESRPISYSAPNGIAFNLLKDDLGTSQEAMGRNYELIVGRGMPAGEYIVNVHLYKSSDAPISGRIGVTLGGESPREVISERFVLERSRQEITVIRFVLDKNGRLIESSKHKAFRALRGNL